MSRKQNITNNFDLLLEYIDELRQQLDYVYSLSVIAINHNFSEYDHTIQSNYWGAITIHIKLAKNICDQIALNCHQIEKSQQIILFR